MANIISPLRIGAVLSSSSSFAMRRRSARTLRLEFGERQCLLLHQCIWIHCKFPASAPSIGGMCLIIGNSSFDGRETEPYDKYRTAQGNVKPGARRRQFPIAGFDRQPRSLGAARLEPPELHTESERNPCAEHSMKTPGKADLAACQPSPFEARLLCDLARPQAFSSLVLRSLRISLSRPRTTTVRCSECNHEACPLRRHCTS